MRNVKWMYRLSQRLLYFIIDNENFLVVLYKWDGNLDVHVAGQSKLYNLPSLRTMDWIFICIKKVDLSTSEWHFEV